jgi:hypothetical protein
MGAEGGARATCGVEPRAKNAAGAKITPRAEAFASSLRLTRFDEGEDIFTCASPVVSFPLASDSKRAFHAWKAGLARRSLHSGCRTVIRDLIDKARR